MSFLRMYILAFVIAVFFAMPQVADAAGTFTTSECLAAVPTDRTVDCGTVTLPLYADKPQGLQIQLPIMIIRSMVSNAHPPLYLLQGGPGGDTIETFVSILNKPDAIIPSDRDIVLVEQRGTTNTTPTLDCPELPRITAELYTGTLTNAQRTDRQMRAWQECADRLRAAGVDLSAFNSTANADDVAAVAAMLGHGTIDLYGVSYGSLLAQHVVVRHPNLVHALVLDGVVPTTRSPQTEWLSSRQTAFANLFADCAADPACNGYYPDLTTRLPALLQRVNDQPLQLTLTDISTTNSYAVVLHGDDVAGVLFQMMYDDELVTFVPMLIDQIERNDLTTFQSLAGLFLFYDGMSEGMQAATTCAEEVAATPSDYRVPTGGLFPLDDAVVTDDIDYTQRWCAIAAVKHLPESVNDTVVSDIPTLVSSGRYDPITPATMADTILPGFRNATAIVTPSGAHGAILGNVCSAAIFHAFLDDPEQTPDTSCLQQQKTVFATPVTVTPTTAIARILNGTNPFGSVAYAAGGGLLWLMFALVVRPLAYLIRRVRNEATPPVTVRAFHLVQYLVSLLALGSIGYLGFILYESALVRYSVAFLFGIPRDAPYYDISLWVLPAGVAVYLLVWGRLVSERKQNILGFLYATSVAVAAGSLIYMFAAMGMYALAR